MDPPDRYYTIRIDTADETLLLDKCLGPCQSYICYRHNNEKGDENPHYHVLLIGDDADTKHIESLRKRVRQHVGGGNGCFSGKWCTNGLLNGISYCAHDHTEPHKKGLYPWDSWISQAPAWVPKEEFLRQSKIGEKKTRVHEDHFRQITFRNMLKTALRWRNDRKMKTKELSAV